MKYIWIILFIPTILFADIHSEQPWEGVKAWKHDGKIYSIQSDSGGMLSVNGYGYGVASFHLTSRSLPIKVNEEAAINITIKQIETEQLRIKNEKGQVIIPNFKSMNEKQKRSWIRDRFKERKYKFEPYKDKEKPNEEISRN